MFVRVTLPRLRSCWASALLVGALLALGAVGVPAQLSRPASPPDGGHFLSRADSLGYDDYRQLDHDTQLERREEAKRWAKRVRTTLRRAAGQVESQMASQILREALDECATVVGLCPYFPEGWLLYANVLNQMGFYDSGEVCLQHAESTLAYERREKRRRELEGDLHRQRAVIAYNGGDWSASAEEALLASEVFEKDAKLRILHARSLSALGEYAEARKILGEVDRESPARAKALSVLGLVEMAAGDLDAAKLAFEEATERGMRGAVFANDRGRLALRRDELDKAVEQFEMAMKALPNFMEARSNLAVAHRRAGRLTQAEAVLQAIVDERPSYGAAHFNLAEVLREEMEGLGESARQVKAQLALGHYSRAMSLGFAPDQVVERRASLAASVQNLEMAEEDFLQIAADPNIGGDVLHRLGRVKRDQGRADIARKLFEMAIGRGEDTAILYSDYGGVLLAQSEFDAAREAYEKALALDGELLITRVNLSIAWMELGEYDTAAEVLAPAVRRAPTHPSVRAQRAQLQRLGARID
jgi:tetratricopeptide (TPR) repeat protein